MRQLTITTAGRAQGGTLVFPVRTQTPHWDLVSLEVSGADTSFDRCEASGQQLCMARARPDQPVTIRYGYDAGSTYPEAMFVSRNSRFTRAADALIDDARALADRPDPALAVAQHVAGLFSYGHPDTRYYDDTDHLPQLCGLTQGSCVDINAYLIASLRAAGITAGYVTGVFFPAEKTDDHGHASANDMHCWVVTRDTYGLREWDIAHHMKLGLTEIAPALDPKPGWRVPLAHSMGLTFPKAGLSDIKLISEPMWLEDGSLTEALNDIRGQNPDWPDHSGIRAA